MARGARRERRRRASWSSTTRRVNVKLLADLLAAKGYAVVTAASGPEALDKVDGRRRPTWCCSTS